jgi:hypothetical protein
MRPTRERARRRFGPLLVIFIFPAAGCSGGGPGKNEKGAALSPWAYEREFNKGAPVSLVLRLDRVDLTLADRIRLEEELQVEEGFEADFPEYLPEDFDGFSVVEISSVSKDASPTGASRAADKGTANALEKPGAGISPAVSVRRKTLTLEPAKSGDLALAPLAVYFHKGGEAQESSFQTEEITVHVKGVDDLGALSVRDLHDIYEAPPVPSSRRALLWAVAGGMALLLAGAAFYYRVRRPRAGPPAIAPHEVAFESLRRLVALQLIEKGQLELFFVHLSGILREYIENRFHVRAPERTSEEFLMEAAQNPELGAHRARLSQFLSLSDRVKFARFRPDEAATQGAFDVLKQFLMETSPHDL